MRKALIGLACASGMLLASATAGVAGPINCGIANKSLKMGRSYQDVADTMGVGVDDIKKCEAEAKEAEAKKASEGGAAAGAAAGQNAGAAAGAAEAK